MNTVALRSAPSSASMAMAENKLICAPTSRTESQTTPELASQDRRWMVDDAASRGGHSYSCFIAAPKAAVCLTAAGKNALQAFGERAAALLQEHEGGNSRNQKGGAEHQRIDIGRHCGRGAQLRDAQSDADCDEGDLADQFRCDVRDHRRVGERGRHAAQDEDARTDHHAAELREGQHVARAVARLAPDDAGDEVAQVVIGHQGEPAAAHQYDDAQPVQADQREAAHANGSDGREDCADTDMQQQPDRDCQTDQRGDDHSDFHRRVRPWRRLVRPQKPPEGADHERNKSRALEALVIDAETTLIFGKTHIHQFEDVDIVSEPARLR